MQRSPFSSWSIRLQIRSCSVLFAMVLAASLSVPNPAQHEATELKHKPWVEKDWTTWTDWDCSNTLRYSPWVWIDEGWGRETGLTSQTRDVTELTSGVTIEFISALPYRQAKLRQLQLVKHYDKMNPAQKQGFDQEHADILFETDDDPIRISYAYSPGNQGYSGIPTLSPRRAALKLADGTIVTASETTLQSPPADISSRGYAILYVFPRKIDGKPLYAPTDKSIALIFGDTLQLDKNTNQARPYTPADFHPGVGGYDFHIADMIYKGKLEY
jgi:hypothetical protein